MKELGKLLVQSRLPIRRSSRAENQPQTEEKTVSSTPLPSPYSRISRRESPRGRSNPVSEKAPETQTSGMPSVYEEPDSWKPRVRAPVIDDMSGLLEGLMSEEDFKQLTRPGRKPVAAKKKRGQCISLCVSTEEAELLRRYAASLDLTFSEWARVALFNSMGKKMPKRPGNPKDKEK